MIGGDRDRIVFSWSGSAIILICTIGIGIAIGQYSGKFCLSAEHCSIVIFSEQSIASFPEAAAGFSSLHDFMMMMPHVSFGDHKSQT